MNVGARDVNLLEVAAQHQPVRRVFERHGVGWLLDVTDLDHSGRLVEDAAAISGVPPAELRAELDRALEKIVPREVTRRLVWREPCP